MQRWSGKTRKRSDESHFPYIYRKLLNTKDLRRTGFSPSDTKLTQMTLPTKIPNDSLGRIGSLKRTSDKSLFPMALGSCGHRITHQLRPINMNGRSILSVTSVLSRFGLQWAWRRFYQVALSPGPLQVAASRVLAWSQLSRKKAGCLVRAQAVLPNRLMNAPRKSFTGPEPGGPLTSILVTSLFPAPSQRPPATNHTSRSDFFPSQAGHPVARVL